MRPPNAVDHELIDFLGTTFQEAAIVLTVVMGLIFSVSPFHLFAFAHLHVGILALVVILVKSCQQTDHTFEEEQDVVEAVDLKLFEKGPS